MPPQEPEFKTTLVKEGKIFLDRDLSCLSLPAIPLNPYTVEVNPPYSVRDRSTTVKLGAESSKLEKHPIFILDDCREQDRGKNLVASHMRLVTACLDEGKFDIQKFHVGGGDHPGRIDNEKCVKALNYLEKSCAPGHKILVFSAVTYISLEEINKLCSTTNDVKNQITLANLTENKDLIRAGINKMPYQSKDKSTYISALKVADKFENLSQKDWAIITGSGNEGPNRINLIGLFSPNTIVAGGLSNNRIHPNSGNNSTVDYYTSYDLSFVIRPVDKKFTVQGTSYSAPFLAEKVAELQKMGMSAKEINSALRMELNTLSAGMASK